MHNNNNNAIEEELDKYLNEINSEEELIQSNETFHGKESLRLLVGTWFSELTSSKALLKYKSTNLV